MSLADDTYGTQNTVNSWRNPVRPLLCVLCLLVTTACSSVLETIYVSPLGYQQLTCGDIDTRRKAIKENIAEVSSQRPSDAEKTAAYLAATGKAEGLLAKLGEGAQASQALEAKTAVPLAQLRGEDNALKVVASEKGCALKE